VAIEKRPGTTGKVSYKVRVDVGMNSEGKRSFKTATFFTLREAQKQERQWKEAANDGTLTASTRNNPDGQKPLARMTVADVFAKWLTVLEGENPKPRTVIEYRRTIDNHILPHIGYLPVQKVSTTIIDGLYGTLRDSGKSNDCIHRCHKRLRQMFAYAVSRRLITINAMDGINPPRVVSSERIILTAAQVQTFLDTAHDDHYSPLWLLLVQTGLRRGEALGMRWTDIDLEKGKLSVRQCVEVLEVPDGVKEDGTPKVRATPHIQTPKSKAALRTIDLYPDTVAALRTHKARQNAQRLRVGDLWKDNDLVFCVADGGMMNPHNVLRNLRVIQQKASLPPFTIHELRHLHATYLLSEGWGHAEVAARLGHENAAITMRIYAHSRKDIPARPLPSALSRTGTDGNARTQNVPK